MKGGGVYRVKYKYIVNKWRNSAHVRARVIGCACVCERPCAQFHTESVLVEYTSWSCYGRPRRGNRTRVWGERLTVRSCGSEVGLAAFGSVPLEISARALHWFPARTASVRASRRSIPRQTWHVHRWVLRKYFQPKPHNLTFPTIPITRNYQFLIMVKVIKSSLSISVR